VRIGRIWRAPQEIDSLREAIARVTAANDWREPTICPLCGAAVRCIKAETVLGALDELPFAEHRWYVCTAAPACNYETERKIDLVGR